MEYVFSIKKIAEGHGLSVSITGMLIVFLALVTITVFLLLLHRILKVVNRIYPEVDEYENSERVESENEIVAAIAYAILNGKLNS
jgi:Na+-transporting methylmalonyl-CoA/oxaloacetate decarboxylase gamma subunit